MLHATALTAAMTLLYGEWVASHLDEISSCFDFRISFFVIVSMASTRNQGFTLSNR